MKARTLSAAWLLAACLPWTLGGCAGIDVLQESAQCVGGPGRQVVLARDQATLERLWRGMSQSPQAAPAPELGMRRALWLADSEKPTAGYGLALSSDILTNQSGVASLKVRATAPAGVAAQVVTRPCLLLALPDGDYKRVDVFDQNGALWGSSGANR